jgi:hypothetical protein
MATTIIKNYFVESFDDLLQKMERHADDTSTNIASVIANDHRTPWLHSPLLNFIGKDNAATSLSLDVPFAYDKQDGEILSRMKNLESLEINLLLLKDQRFFKALAAAPKLKFIKIMLNTHFHYQFDDFDLFAVKTLQMLHVVSDCLDMHALITYAAVCHSPINLKALIMEYPKTNSGSLKNKRHTSLFADTKLISVAPFLTTEEMEMRGFPCENRVFLDDETMKIFPSLKRVFVCKNFHFLHQTKLKTVGEMINIKKNRQTHNSSNSSKRSSSNSTSKVKKMDFTYKNSNSKSAKKMMF